MPLTFAHPAAVFPLQKRLKSYGVLSALVVGSLVPDFAYLPYMPVTRIQTHSLASMFWFCLPVGLVLYFVFEFFMKTALIELMPVSVKCRFDKPIDNQEKASKRRSFLNVCVSVLIGTATHILWDSFTHEDGLFVQLIPYLQANLFSVYSYHVVLYKVFQHVSTLTGTLLIIYWLYEWFRFSDVITSDIQSVLPEWQRLLWITLILVGSTFIGVLAGYGSMFGKSGLPAIQSFEKNTIIFGFVAISLFVFSYCSVYYFLAIKIKKEK